MIHASLRTKFWLIRYGLLPAVVIGLVACGQVQAQLPDPINVFSNRLNSVRYGGTVYSDGDRDSAFVIATDGDLSSTNRWDTCCNDVNTAGNSSVTDFAGLYYGTPATFDSVTVHVYSFKDGGDWAEQPNLYILKENVDTNTQRPETSVYWQQVTGFTQVGSHTFDPITLNNGTGAGSFTYDLSALDVDLRTGYGWAVGGVDGTRTLADDRRRFIGIRELEATGSAAASVTAPDYPSEPYPVSLIANNYHTPKIGGADHDATRSTAFELITNGIVDHGGVRQIDGFDTCCSDNGGVLTDFVGLKYSAPMQFDTLTLELGHQFGNGGTWESRPKLYLLQYNDFDSGEARPEASGNWVEVPVTEGMILSEPTYGTASVSSGGTFSIDLSSLPANARSGWGWAVGGVDGNANESGTGNFVSVSEMQATGAAAPSYTPPVPSEPQPVNIVSNVYHSVNAYGISLASQRHFAFESVVDGIADTVSGFDTCCDAPGTETDFVGLQYNSMVRFDEITIQLGNQFSNGGDWDSQPRIFILKNPVDTGSTAPEDDPENWFEITGFLEENEHLFDPLVTPGVGGEIRFNLEGISAADRTGWGWAVGGVDGNSSSEGTNNFISVSELSAEGVVITNGPIGDLNNDHVVDRADLAILASKLGTTSALFTDGDFDGDTVVGLADLALLQANFGATGGQPSPHGSAVPEPSSIALLALGAIALTGRRRQWRRG